MDGEDEKPVPGLRAEESPEHGMKVLRGLNHLKMEKVLCDVALIAEGKEINFSNLNVHDILSFILV